MRVPSVGRSLAAVTVFLGTAAVALGQEDAGIVPVPERAPVIDAGPLLDGLGPLEAPSPSGSDGGLSAPPPPNRIPPPLSAVPPVPGQAAETGVPPSPLLAEPGGVERRLREMLPDLVSRPRLASGETALVTVSGNGVLRLSGERAVARLVIDVPPTAGEPGLLLTYRNSINVLPEASGLRVLVNGTELDTLALDAFDGFRVTEIATDLLVPGTNEITLEVSQRHRIFCGIDASFAIWTEIDLSRSGVEAAGLAAGTSVARFGEALAAWGRAELLSVRAAPEADPAVVEALARRLATAVGGEVTIGSAFDPVPLSVGRPRVLVRAGAAPSARVRRGGDDALVLEVVHGPPGESGTGGSLPDLTGLVAGGDEWKVPDPVPAMLVPGRAASLDALGYVQRDGVASFYVTGVAFRLPQDFLALASQQAVLFLDYGFAEDLPENAQMLVKVNGTTVRLLPLDRGGGEMKPTLDVGFLASLLHAGVNRLSFEIILEAEDTRLPCPPWPAVPVFISGSSVLTVPDLPRMSFRGMETVLPRLTRRSVTFGRDDGEGFGGLDPSEREAFTSVFPRAATGAGSPASLTVLRVGAVWPGVTGDLSLNRRTLLRLLDPPLASRPVAPEPRETLAPVFGTPADEGSPALETVWNAGERAAGWLRSLALPGDPPLSDWLEGKAAEAVLFQPDGSRPGALVLVLADSAAPGGVATAMLGDPWAGDGPHGRLSLLSRDAGWEGWRPPLEPPRLAEPLTVWNLRAVLGNYASWLPVGFTGLVFALTGLSALIAILFVLRTREHNQE